LRAENFFSCSQASSCEWRLDYRRTRPGSPGTSPWPPPSHRTRSPRRRTCPGAISANKNTTHSFRLSTPESRESRTGDDRGVEQNGNQRSNGPWRACGRQCAARRPSSRWPRPAPRTGCCRRSPSIVVKTHTPWPACSLRSRILDRAAVVRVVGGLAGDEQVSCAWRPSYRGSADGRILSCAASAPGIRPEGHSAHPACRRMHPPAKSFYAGQHRQLVVEVCVQVPGHWCPVRSLCAVQCTASLTTGWFSVCTTVFG
jgi:hypothetical protein